jgi:hypothetical protein
MTDTRSANAHHRQALDNRRTAAIARCDKWEAELVAVESGQAQPKTVWEGETQEDARANYAALLRQMILDERQKIAVMTEDLTEMDR